MGGYDHGLSERSVAIRRTLIKTRICWKSTRTSSQFSPSMSLNQLGGACHATACRNLFSIMERKAYCLELNSMTTMTRGTSLEGYTATTVSFAPWDPRNTATKTRVAGYRNRKMPLAVLYIPSADLVRQGGRITDRGTILASRPVPFKLVKEAWFCVLSSRNSTSLELIEKILDEKLEDELVLDFHPSPILSEFRKERTPARIMELLCNMPAGPHTAGKERTLSAFAATVVYHHEDTRHHHYMKEKEGIIFLIDLRMGGDSSGMRMRICPACYSVVPACTSRCTSCSSQIISCGKYQRNVQRETLPEIPSSSMAQTMEAATAAVLTIDVGEDDQAGTMTVAEPETEVEEQQSEGEPESDEEMLQEIPDYKEEVTQEMLEERRPLLLPGRTLVTNPDLTQARAATQPPYYPENKQGRCIDAIRTAFAYAYMAYCLLRTMYKVWPTTSSWVTMPYFQTQEKFAQGCRYDVLGNWPGDMSEVDPETKISKDVTDEEVLEFARVKADPEDPDQVLSTLVRGSIQMGYSRDTFNPETYINRGQTTQEMHYSCLCVLGEIVPKLTGYTSSSLIRPPPAGPREFLYVDPVGVVLIQSLKDTSADTIALLIDHNIQVPAKFTDKVVKRKIDKEKNPQAHKGRQAVQHLTFSDYMAAGQTSIMDASVTQEHRDRVAIQCQSFIVRQGRQPTGMPTPMSTKEKRERANPRLLKNVKMHGVVWERDNR